MGFSARMRRYCSRSLKELKTRKSGMWPCCGLTSQLSQSSFYPRKTRPLSCHPCQQNILTKIFMPVRSIQPNNQSFIQFITPIISFQSSQFDSLVVDSKASIRQSEKIGYIHLIYSQDKIRHETTSAVRMVVMVTSGIVIISLVLTFIFVHRLLTAGKQACAGNKENCRW